MWFEVIAEIAQRVEKYIAVKEKWKEPEEFEHWDVRRLTLGWRSVRVVCDKKHLLG